jgi:tRNA splicing ligase
MIPEVKTIYHSMLTRKSYDETRPLPDYAVKVVERYDDILDLEVSELENVRNVLNAMIKNHYTSIPEQPNTDFIRKLLKKLGI